VILTNIFFSDSTSNLVYATTHSTITVLDLRTMRVLQTLENPRHYGPITSLCIDRKRTWIIVGTSTGVLTLWDKRFGLLIRSWHVGIASSGRSVRVHQCVVHPSRSRGNWIMVSVETSRKGSDRSSTPLVEVWDIEKAVLVETFLTRTGSPTDAIPEPQEMLGVDAETTPAAAIAALVRSRQNKSSLEETSPTEELPQPPASDIRTMVVGSDFGGYATSFRSEFGEFEHNSGSRAAGRGYMITGSEDSKIRFWDLGKFDKTTVLSGLELDHEKPWYK
jgi:phosphoinositide-3-kinase, regulatory subunit 4